MLVCCLFVDERAGKMTLPLIPRRWGLKFIGTVVSSAALIRQVSWQNKTHRVSQTVCLPRRWTLETILALARCPLAFIRSTCVFLQFLLRPILVFPADFPRQRFHLYFCLCRSLLLKHAESLLHIPLVNGAEHLTEIFDQSRSVVKLPVGRLGGKTRVRFVGLQEAFAEGGIVRFRKHGFVLFDQDFRSPGVFTMDGIFGEGRIEHHMLPEQAFELPQFTLCCTHVSKLDQYSCIFVVIDTSNVTQRPKSGVQSAQPRI